VPPSISDERLTCVGLDQAQAGGENAGPSLRCSNLCAVGWDGPFFFFGPKSVNVFFRFSFLFSIFWKTGKLVNDSKLSMIKKFSCGEILDKNIFMSVVFSCKFRNFVFNFLVKFDPTIGFNWKIESN
jgi:hypothetical protein